jgi:succinoglycan biosynthesis protein ExoM
VAPDVSVCVATCRRPEGLARLLESLAGQKLPSGCELEVLVVDNDPAGSAGPVLHAFGGRLPLRVFAEPRRNIARARNRAALAAAGSWLAFIDDDECADETWLAEHWSCVHEYDCDGSFGPVVPRLVENVTPWLAADLFYGHPRHDTGTPLAPADLRAGNAFVRRTLFAGRRFDPEFGRTGGEDTDLFGRMLAAGARFLWCDEARVTERVPPERHRPAWLSRRAFRGGSVHTRIEARRRRPGAPPRAAAPRAALAALLCAAALPPALLLGRAAAFRVWLRLCVQAGHLWGALGLAFEEYGDEA